MDILAKREAMVLATEKHFAADMLVKGTYGGGDGAQFKGCSVGCLAFEVKGKPATSSFIHAFVAKSYGYPEWLAYLQDTIFEGLPNGPQGENSRWHVQLAKALRDHCSAPEYDWDAALHRVHVGILRISYRTAGSAKEAVQRVLDLHERAGRGEDISDEMWSAAASAARSAAESAESAAWSAAESAAWSAARSAARSAAWSAAWSAWSAASAAESAAESAARSAAESAAWSAWSARSAESAARSAWSAWSAARSAAYQELRDAVLEAFREPAQVA